MSTAEVTDIAIRQQPTEMTVEQMIAQTQKIQLCMRAVMKEGEHFGVIPGTKTKPTLLKPGAEKLCLMFRLDPQYEIMSAVETPERISFTVRCTLYHIPTGSRIASGLGSCNSRENKYIRPAPKTCPQCGGAFLIDGNPDYERDLAYKGGMLCYKKKGGCGAKFKPDDEKITKQATGIADPADLHNTILKMGCKRALVAAVLNGTAASDFFTQDLDDLADKAAAAGEPEYIAPDDNQRIRDAIGDAPGPKDVPAAAPSPPSAATTSKPKKTTAADIPHEGVPVTPDQIKLIHVLRGKCGGVYSGDEGRPQWVKIVQVYRDQKGDRAKSSTELSRNQASHLIDRMNGYLAKVTARAEEVPDVSGHLSPNPELEKLIADIDGTGDEERLTDEICSTLRVMQVGDLVTPERVSAAFALVAAWKTNSYDAIKARIIARMDP
jgi:hypothetical protein